MFDGYRADDPIRAMHRCRRWEKGRRLIALRRDMLCRICGYRAATERDHIRMARLVVERFREDEFCNADRCQGLCLECHTRKTAIEVGFRVKKETL